MTTRPEVLWAQRSSSSAPEKNIVLLTVNLPDIDQSTLNYSLEPEKLSFQAQADGRDYAFDLDLYGDAIPAESKKSLTNRGLDIVLRKKDVKLDYWPRLTKGRQRNPFIKTDFSKWVDEDEQGEPVNFDEFGEGRGFDLGD